MSKSHAKTMYIAYSLTVVVFALVGVTWILFPHAEQPWWLYASMFFAFGMMVLSFLVNRRPLKAEPKLGR